MKRIIAIVAAVLLVVGGAAYLLGRGGGAPDEQVLHVGSQKGGTKALMLASGVLKGAPYRIEWSEFPAAQHLLEAIGGGAVDVGLVGDAPFQFAYQAGSPIVAVGAQSVTERPSEALAVIVPAQSPARSLADLRGKKIATTRGSVGHYLLLVGLQRAGISADAVQITFLSPGDAKAAFSSGAIDGWSTWTPYLTAALQEKARVLVDAQAFGPQFGFEVANRSAAGNKRALITDFLEREARALAWAKSHNDEYAAVLSAETGLPIEIARIFAQKNARIAVPIDDRVVAAQQLVLDGFTQAGALKPSRPVGEGYDRTFSQSPAPKG